MDRELRDLEEATARIWELAHEFGLDPFPTHFEIVPPAIMYEFGAYGLPGRFAHWSHGKAYHQMKTMYDYGLSKIYELVINTDPCYGFLMEGNSPLQNKLVVAHVLAHSDFFKHNVYFSHTSRQMLETAGANADRIRRYEYAHGRLEVEQFLDAVLSIQEHIDPQVFLRRRPDGSDGELERPTPPPETPYDDLLKLGAPRQIQEPPHRRRLPEEPEKDVLRFLAEHAPDLADWQRDVVDIVRGEMLYFLPQMQTKILNEGWAAYWHAQILRSLELSAGEYVEFARLHAGVLAPSRMHLNPYYVGMKIFEDIRRRWDEPTAEERERFGRRGGEGLAKMFEVRELENDASFLRSYLTRELVDSLDLYIYRREGAEWVIVEKDWQKVRDLILRSMTNFGHPYIVVEDGDYGRNRELFLRHQHEGQALDLTYAERTLQYVYRLWGRPVHLATVLEEEPILLSYDGVKNVTSSLDEDQQ